MDRPVVVAMNMMDEAARLGLKIDGPALMTRLGVPVYAAGGQQWARGQGIIP